MWNIKKICKHIAKSNPMDYNINMITIVELPEYLKRIEKWLTEEERENVIRYLALNPKAGVLIRGTGGIRKIRWARNGMGKSEKENLNKAERNELAKLTSLLVKSYKSR